MFKIFLKKDIPSMAIPYLAVRVYFCMIALIESSFAVCEGKLRLTEPEMAAMMNGTYPECRNVDLRYELPICEVGEADVGDWPTRASSAERLPPLKMTCPDESWNRTCYPVPTDDVIYAFACVCSSAPDILNAADVRDTTWSDLKAVSPPVDGVFYTRHLMIVGGECITQEFIKMGPVIQGYNLPDSVYTASSINVASSNVYDPYRARLDTIYTSGCGWVAGVDDAGEWLGITLPDQYIIRGCVLVKCSDSKYLTMVTVSTSDDDIIWRDVAVGKDISTRYDSDDAAYIWFSTRFTSRYWKIFTLSGSLVSPRVKADLIGFQS